MPYFSVIIPVYNVALYLRECLDSVRAQTFTDWEAICVDDGSTDGSGAILDEYATYDSRFRVIHQSNNGVGAARNTGLDVCKGEWMLSVDPDDTVDCEYISSFAKAIADNPTADMVWCDYYVNNIDSEYRTNNYCSNDADEHIKMILKPDGMWATLCTRAFRLDFVRRHKLKFIEGRNLTMEDLLFLTDFLLPRPIIKWFDACHYHYIQHSSSLTHAKWSDERFLKQCEVLKGLRDRICNDALKRLVDARIKVFLYWTYQARDISNIVFLKAFPEFCEIGGVGLPLWHQVFYKMAHYGCRMGVIRMLETIRIICHEWKDFVQTCRLSRRS